MSSHESMHNVKETAALLGWGPQATKQNKSNLGVASSFRTAWSFSHFFGLRDALGVATCAPEMNCNRSICRMVHLVSNASSSVQLRCVTPLNTSSISMHVQYLWKCVYSRGCSRWLSGKEPNCKCRKRKRCGFDPWWGRSPGGTNPLQYSCLENPVDREAQQATVHWVSMSWT